MTLTQYLRVLRQQWVVVALLAMLGLGGAAAFTYRQVPIYSAQTQLFISVRSPDPTISTLSQGGTFTQQRVKSYAALVTSPEIAQAVITQLGLPYTAEELAGKISASSPLDTVLLEISVTDTDPDRAARIANAVGAQFPHFIATLETPAGRVVSPVKVSITRPAEVPGAPVSPRIPLNLALGLIVGLGLGIGAAVLRDQFNTTVSGVSDIERLTGSIPLGVVPYDSTAAKQPLVTADQFGGRAEAFRTLRTNLQFADVDDPPRVITITSALPAEGKTTTACNIALTLAQSGARVVLVEGDLRKPAVGKYFGISNAAGLTNVLAGQHELRDVIVSYQRDTLAVLPSGPTPPNPSEMLGSQQMSHLLNSLANHYDLVIIDAPPLLPVTDAAVLAAAADGAILVVRHGKSRREEVERAQQALSSVNAKVLGTVLNFAPRKKRRGGYDGYGYGYGYGPATPVEQPKPSTSRSKRSKQKEVVAAAPAPAPARSMPVSVTLPPDEGANQDQYRPDQYQPDQYRSDQYQPGQYQPDQLQPDQFQSDQFQQAGPYQQSQFQQPGQYSPPPPVQTPGPPAQVQAPVQAQPVASPVTTAGPPRLPAQSVPSRSGARAGSGGFFDRLDAVTGRSASRPGPDPIPAPEDSPVLLDLAAAEDDPLRTPPNGFAANGYPPASRPTGSRPTGPAPNGRAQNGPALNGPAANGQAANGPALNGVGADGRPAEPAQPNSTGVPRHHRSKRSL